MKQHVFQAGENIEQIARQYGFRLPATIWDDPSNESLRQLRKSAYALASGDVLNIPELQIKQEDASDEKRHVFQLGGLIRPAFYSRLVPDPDLPAARFGPVFSQPGAVGFDVSFAPHLGGALSHVAAAHDGAKFRAVVAGRGRLAEGPLLQSVAYLLMGNKPAWVADALARHDEADLRVLLTWIANVLGFPCDPGRPGDSSAQGFGHALRRLRSAADITHGAVLYKPDMEPRPEEDLGAIFDAVEERLRAAANLSAEAMKQARGKIEFLSPAWVDLTRADGIEGTDPAACLDLVLFDDQVVKATPGQVHPLLSKLSSFMYSSLEQKETTTSFEKTKLDIVEFEDVHFGAKRSVFLPTELTAAGPGEHWGITGADVLVSALRNAQAHPTRVLLVRGHTDSTSTKAQNFALSKKRARGVELILRGIGAVDQWVEHATADGTLDDAWEYLRWIDERFGFGCKPSPADKPDPANDAKALVVFRRRYNEDVKDFAPAGNPYQAMFTEPVPLRGSLSRHDWRGFFEMMQKHLLRQMRISMTDLLELQLNLNFKSEAVGCGESHPLNLEDRERKRLAMYPEEDLGESPSDRRVDLIFLDPDEFARIPDPMLCHETADAGACKPELCMLYDQRFFEFRRLSAEPQKGKIEIIERTVWRNPRLFTDDTDEFREEVSGDFTPILEEHVRVLVRVTPPYVPFEGQLRMGIVRRTSDEQKPQSLVATVRWRDQDGNTALKLTKPSLLILRWKGYAGNDVKREYSDRDVHDENQDKMVFIPMMGMSNGDRAPQGAYFVSAVALVEKDKQVAAEYHLNEEEQNELAMVVQVPVNVWFSPNDNAYTLLNAVGFGSTDEPDTVPFVEVYTRALVRRIASHVAPDCNVRLVGTVREDTLSIGIRLKIDCYQYHLGTEMGWAPGKGYTYATFKLDGQLLRTNLFVWYDAFDPTQPSSVGLSGTQSTQPKGSRSEDMIVHSRMLIEDTKNEEALVFCRSVFGPVGFPDDRRVLETTVISGELTGDKVIKVTLVGGPNTPRQVDASGTVTGCVMGIDESSTTITENPATGAIQIASTNFDVVPVQRAQAISKALNAATAYVAHLAAHELGHMLGLGAKRSDQPIDMQDGTKALPYMDQDPAGHDTPVTTTGMMVSGEEWPYGQLLGLLGPPRVFKQNQVAYLRAVLPRAADFASASPPEQDTRIDSE